MSSKSLIAMIGLISIAILEAGVLADFFDFFWD
jgi:hypothetical protein